MIFNSSQRTGILLLLILIICVIILPRQFSKKEHDFFLLQEANGLETDTIVISNDSSYNTKPVHKTVIRHKRTTPKVELNTADSTALDAIPGIGPYYASRIIRYRNLLGGYCTVEQLKEVKMTYFNVDSSARHFTVNPALIVKRNLDTMDFKAVLRHPYLEYEDVKLIFNAKRKFKTISYPLLEENQVLAPDKLKKIKPYFQ